MAKIHEQMAKGWNKLTSNQLNFSGKEFANALNDKGIGSGGLYEKFENKLKLVLGNSLFESIEQSARWVIVHEIIADTMGSGKKLADVLKETMWPEKPPLDLIKRVLKAGSAFKL